MVPAVQSQETSRDTQTQQTIGIFASQRCFTTRFPARQSDRQAILGPTNRISDITHYIQTSLRGALTFTTT